MSCTIVICPPNICTQYSKSWNPMCWSSSLPPYLPVTQLSRNYVLAFVDISAIHCPSRVKLPKMHHLVLLCTPSTIPCWENVSLSGALCNQWHSCNWKWRGISLVLRYGSPSEHMHPRLGISYSEVSPLLPAAGLWLFWQQSESHPMLLLSLHVRAYTPSPIVLKQSTPRPCS